MTIQDQFYNYQQNPSNYNWDAPPWEINQPCTVVMRTYMEERWGLTWLGTHGDRPIVGGEAPSTHAFGMAPDMRYESPGPGLLVADTEIIPWLIATSKETGVQAIHHYRRSLIWRPPGTSGRPIDSDGWRLQAKGTQMGQSWALWLHIEFHPSERMDGRSIQEKLDGILLPPPQPQPEPPIVVNPPVTPPAQQPGATHIVDVTIEVIRRGSVGPKVAKCQAILNANFGQDCGAADGNFGARTDEAVLNVQRFFGLTADGVVGPKTWGVLLNLP